MSNLDHLLVASPTPTVKSLADYVHEGSTNGRVSNYRSFARHQLEQQSRAVDAPLVKFIAEVIGKQTSDSGKFRLSSIS